MFISIHAKKGYLNYICISHNNVSMKIIEIFYVIWHLVMLIHTSALINACTKHFQSIQNNGEKTKKSKMHVRGKLQIPMLSICGKLL